MGCIFYTLQTYEKILDFNANPIKNRTTSLFVMMIKNNKYNN